MSVSFNRLVQFTVAVIAIQLEFVGFHGIVFLSFTSCSIGCGKHQQALVSNLPTKDKRNIPYFTYRISTFLRVNTLGLTTALP